MQADDLVDWVVFKIDGSTSNTPFHALIQTFKKRSVDKGEYLGKRMIQKY